MRLNFLRHLYLRAINLTRDINLTGLKDLSGFRLILSRLKLVAYLSCLEKFALMAVEESMSVRLPI